MTQSTLSTLYLPPDLAQEPAMDEKAFWVHCTSRRLMFQRCGECGLHRHPPIPICPACRSNSIAWTEAPAEGEVFSYTIVHHPSHPAMAACVPYNVAIIVFPQLDNVRLISNVVDAPPEQMAVGMKVKLHWEGPVDGTWLPRFRRSTA